MELMEKKFLYIMILKYICWNFLPLIWNKRRNNLSSINEHVSCLIAKELGLNSQNTLLGKFNDKIVVACEDFEINGFKLLNFTSVKNSLISSKN